jgi:mannose-6-phosphate isomerase-like protein (cupin superfamily)
VRYWLDAADASGADAENGVRTRALFGAAHGCEEFEQRLLAVDGPTGERSDPECDEVLYVLAGTGTGVVGGESVVLAPDTAVFVGRGTGWRVEAADALRLVSVLVRDPLPAGSTHAVVAGGHRATATAGREFTLLATPDCGCASVTQFVGHIPVGRAPDHFHRYDEVVYVLAGSGTLHIDGESRPLRPGTAVHLPATLVHCLANDGPGEMHVLGVFRPAGSPAEAFYPDGTRAEY